MNEYSLVRWTLLSPIYINIKYNDIRDAIQVM